MSVPAAAVAEDHRGPGGPVLAGGSSLEPLVARLSAGYGPDPRAVRPLAEEVLASFAGARVQGSVRNLVDKRLRDTFRARTDRRPRSSWH